MIIDWLLGFSKTPSFDDFNWHPNSLRPCKILWKNFWLKSNNTVQISKDQSIFLCVGNHIQHPLVIDWWKIKTSNEITSIKLIDNYQNIHFQHIFKERSSSKGTTLLKINKKIENNLFICKKNGISIINITIEHIHPTIELYVESFQKKIHISAPLSKADIYLANRLKCTYQKQEINVSALTPYGQYHNIQL